MATYSHPRRSDSQWEVLQVSDSDKTQSKNEDSINNNNSLLNKTNREALIDLTICSTTDSDIPETQSNTSLFSYASEDGTAPRHDRSSGSWRCSPISRHSPGLGRLTQQRLDEFFDNIPEASEETDSYGTVIRKGDAEQVSCREVSDSEGDKKNISKNKQTEAGVKQSLAKSSESSESQISPIRTRVNISAKINVNIQIEQSSDESDSSSQEESPTNVENNSGLYRRAPAERFIDDEMMSILSDIYGDKWQTPKMMQLCLPQSKQTPRKKEASAVRRETPLRKNIKVSFLNSLKAETPLELCATNAIKFRKSYDANKDELLHYLYDLYNEKVFRNKLDVELEWNKKLATTAGRCFNIKRNNERKCRIQLSNKVITSAERMCSTLIHEMCHAAAWIFDMENGHGQSWKKWTRQATAAFPELHPISVCHRYEIEYKYTYQCTTCKAKYNAHSRSKKVENIRCRYCHGKIEILINKKNKDGQMVSTPAKSAKGFALFVKENYNKNKQNENTHTETMKLLSQQFAALSTEDKRKYCST